MVDFYGFHVGIYTSPMDPMGTTQLYRDYFINHYVRIPMNQPGFNGMSLVGFDRCSPQINRSPQPGKGATPRASKEQQHEELNSNPGGSAVLSACNYP